MGIRLSAIDIRHASRCAETLLAPLDAASVEEWRKAVVAQLRELTAADAGTMRLQSPETPLFYSDTFSPETLRQYQKYLAAFHVRYPALQRLTARGVCTRRQMWWGFEREFRASTLYNDLLVPNRVEDSLLIAERDGNDLDFTMLILNRERDKSFGRREMALLRLLRPAFRAGVAVVQGVRCHYGSLGRVVDSLPLAAAVFSTDGALLHRNPALAHLLANEVQHGDVLDSAGQAARDAGSGALAPGGGVTRAVAGRGGHYRLHAVRCQPHVLGSSRELVMVTIEQQPNGAPPVGASLEHYHLTPRERQVAIVLGRGCSNAELAERLGISPHTAERHTERVLSKLGVHRRAQIAGILQGWDPASTK